MPHVGNLANYASIIFNAFYAYYAQTYASIIGTSLQLCTATSCALPPFVHCKVHCIPVVPHATDTCFLLPQLEGGLPVNFY